VIIKSPFTFSCKATSLSNIWILFLPFSFCLCEFHLFCNLFNSFLMSLLYFLLCVLSFFIWAVYNFSYVCFIFSCTCVLSSFILLQNVFFYFFVFVDWGTKSTTQLVIRSTTPWSKVFIFNVFKKNSSTFLIVFCDIIFLHWRQQHLFTILWYLNLFKYTFLYLSNWWWLYFFNHFNFKLHIKIFIHLFQKIKISFMDLIISSPYWVVLQILYLHSLLYGL
jgi:hypothetical protein